MSAAAEEEHNERNSGDAKKWKKEFVVSEPQSVEELNEHLKRHTDQGYQIVQVISHGPGFVAIFSKEVPWR